jgi:ABC-type branched-subunit amino acid transport system substrate-binding protein
MKKRLVVLMATLTAVLTVTLPGALAGSTAEPGLTATSIKIGTTMPLSGPASLYAPIATGMRVYFSHINARRAAGDGKRGVYGRQIIFKVEDDAYNPVQTAQQTRKLVEQDRVFALVGGLGTEQQMAVRAYLNQRKVPQIYVSTGASTWGRQHRQFPWTIGWQPDYVSEGIAYAKWLKANRPNARVAVLYQNDDYGKDYLQGFRSQFGRSIIAQQTYEPGAASVASQTAALRASGADTFLILAIPTPTIQALVTAYRLGWRPTLLVNSVSAVDTFLTLAQGSAGSADAVNGIVTTTYLKDPAATRYQRDAQVRFYKTLMARYAPNANVNNTLYYYGMAKAADFVQALYRAGRNPTRASLMRAVENLKYKSPWLLPGAQLHTTPTNAFPIKYQRLTRFNNGTFTEFGPLQKIR